MMSPMGVTLHNLHGSLSDNLQHLFPSTPLACSSSSSKEQQDNNAESKDASAQDYKDGDVKGLSETKGGESSQGGGLSVSTDAPHMTVTILSTPPASVERAVQAKKDATDAQAAQQLGPTGLFLPAPSPSSFFR